MTPFALPPSLPPFVAIVSPATGETILMATEDVIVAYERLVALLCQGGDECSA